MRPEITSKHSERNFLNHTGFRKREAERKMHRVALCADILQAARNSLSPRPQPLGDRLFRGQEAKRQVVQRCHPHQANFDFQDARYRRCARNSCTVNPTSRAIWRSKIGDRSRPPCTDAAVARPSSGRNRLYDPQLASFLEPSATRMTITSNGPKTGSEEGARSQATTTICLPTKSPAIAGASESRIMEMTSQRLPLSSSSVSPWP